MKISVLSLFPDLVRPYFAESLVKKAIERGLIEAEVVDIRDFATDKHRTCDDYPYGGGPGMVLKVEPLFAAIESVKKKESMVVLPSPSGVPFTRVETNSLAGESHLILISGRYEGIDQRVIDAYVDREYSIGDFVISSGELASLVVIDATVRLIDGFLSAPSLEQESFEDGLLEHPQYTRPGSFRGSSVPEVLRNGHHAQIETWRMMKRVEKTAANRPDLLARRYR